MSYTSMAEYLSVDRSAMMRELKMLSDEGIIEKDGKKLRIPVLENWYEAKRFINSPKTELFFNFLRDLLLTVLFWNGMINQILEDEDTEYQTESFESNCFGPPYQG